ncbi:MAG: hypothetical protein ACJAZB_001206 [Psychrosphaera sp.]|jgi:hypothetical protein
MSSQLMNIFKIVLISVLLNTAFVQSEHQLTHISQNHTLEQCDICSHSSSFDDIILPTTYSFEEFNDNNLVIKPEFLVAKQTQVTILHARAPPYTA